MHHGQYCRKRVWIIGEQKAQRKRKSQYELPHRYFGKHVIDQMRGRLHHPPCPATGAEASALAGECNEMFVKAAIALDAKKAMLKQAALEVVFELLAHK